MLFIFEMPEKGHNYSVFCILENFKLKNFNKEGNYWELSEEIFSRINEDNRQNHVEYMIAHPRVAKALGTNIH